jgi:hypothetical protein
MNTNTYTREQIMSALGLTSPNSFHYLRRTYPQAFVVIHQGTGKNNPTLYDKTAMDKFIQWRKARKDFSNA